MMGNGYVHSAGTESWLMIFVTIAVAVLAVAIIVYLVRSFLQPQTAGGPAAGQQVGVPAARSAESPQTILKRRYAAGEIDRELYLQILEELDQP